MLSPEKVEQWLTFARNIDRLRASKPPNPAELSKLAADYDRRFEDFIGKNEATFYVSMPTKWTKRQAVTSLDLHFVDYRVDSNMNRLVSMISLERIKEEPDPRKIHTEISAQIDETTSEIANYAANLGDVHATVRSLIDKLPATEAAKPTKERRSVPVTNGSPMQLTVNQLILLRAAAGYLADNFQQEEQQRYRYEVDAFTTILRYVDEAEKRLGRVGEALQDEGTRNKIWLYVGPIAKHFEELSGRPLARFARPARHLLYGAFGATAFAVACNTFWPFFGEPGLLGLGIAALVGAFLGFSVGQGPLARWRVRAQSNRLRNYFDDKLRREGNAESFLGTLNWTVDIPPKPAGDKRPIWKRLLDAAETEPSRNEPVALPAAIDDADLSFANAGRLTAHPLLAVSAPFVSAIVALLLAVVPSVGPSAASILLARHVPDASPPAQLLRLATGRELCEIVSGQVIWQDDVKMYVLLRGEDKGHKGDLLFAAWSQVLSLFGSGPETAVGDVLSVAKGDVAEIRYGGARLTGAQPCGTQKELFAVAGPSVVVNPAGVGDITIPLTVPINVPVSVPVSVPVTVSTPDNPPVTTTTTTNNVSFYSNLSIDGTAVTLLDGEPGYRYVVLPMSWNDVGLGELLQRADYLRSVYQLYVGRVTSLQAGYDERIDVHRIVRPIYEALKASTAAGCTIRIDVRGYASDMTTAAWPDNANYLLAEGRRQAVLLALGFTGRETELSLSGTGSGKLILVGSRAEIPKVGENIMTRPPRFASDDLMVEGLKSWYAEPAEADERLEESLARSVVVGIAEEDLGTCPAAG